MSGARQSLLTKTEVHPHRYHFWRIAAQLVTIAVLFLVPISGLARLDLYGGNHLVLFRAATWREALAGVIVGIAACYMITFVINIACGRMFCGWGCPIGFLNRLSDVAALKKLKQPQWKLLRNRIAPVAHSLIMVFACLLWWTDVRALVSFDVAGAIAWGALIGSTAMVWALGIWMRWRFCTQLCPIGVYYSFVAPAENFGVYFREATTAGKIACIHCDACVKVCPVDLNPMDLAAPASIRGGLSVTEAPGANHCLKCGDCIQACEFMMEKARREHVPPLQFGFFDGPSRVSAADQSEQTRHSSADSQQSEGIPVPKKC